MDLMLDANFLVLPFQFNLEIFDEFDRLTGGNHELYTLDRALNEALNLKDGRYRQMVRRLIDIKDVQIINTRADKPVDQQLLEFAYHEGFVICTNDRELRKALREHNLPNIYMRQEDHLEAENMPRL